MTDKAVFITFSDGYYKFLLDDGEIITFEEINPFVLEKFDLKKDKTLEGQTFLVTYSDIYDDVEDDYFYNRIENLIIVTE